MIEIFGGARCGYTIMCAQHLSLAGQKYTIEFYDQSPNELPLPQVYVDQKLVGGFEELIKRYPL
jgi:hypothetical protein